jgi:hypothetical protein
VGNHLEEVSMQIIFHIGQQKTGSTAIQSQLDYNRSRLSARGLLYPAALGKVKSTFIADLINQRRTIQSSREKIIHRLHLELSGSHERVLFSNENLFGLRDVQRLKDTFQQYATSWRVLCYLRRPDEHIVSLYQQKVKGGFSTTFDRYFEETANGQYYRYAQQLEKWAKVFGDNAVEVRLFHRNTLQRGAWEDFAEWIGVDLQGLARAPEERANESFDRVNTEVLRFLNLCQIEQPDLIQRHDIGRIQGRLRALNTGERLRLDTERATLLHERFREDHERLAKRYLSAEHATFLLAPPANVPLPLPVDSGALSERMMALFNDPDLACLAVEKAKQPTGRLRVPPHLRPSGRDKKLMEIVRSPSLSERVTNWFKSLR